ncbi:MAG: GTP cyclohydrolase II [Saprospiraceae bacterium]|nr:GTP cyclohydrolase II [Saprospiraceae bacterium]
MSINLATLISIQAQAQLPTQFGEFTITVFAERPDDPMPHIALSRITDPSEVPFVRIHSECITGEVFGSKKCDCGPQLHRAIEIIAQRGGHLIYLRQEGRGIGLINKIKAYHLQDEGMNTLEANIHLGFKGDERDYQSGVNILKLLEVNRLNLITNNPLKLDYLTNAGIIIEKRIPLIIPAEPQNLEYLRVKKDFMGHLI